VTSPLGKIVALIEEQTPAAEPTMRPAREIADQAVPQYSQTHPARSPGSIISTCTGGGPRIAMKPERFHTPRSREHAALEHPVGNDRGDLVDEGYPGLIVVA
jgi:hypothetical protein